MQILWQSAIRGTLIATCLFLLAACQKAEIRHAATLERASLMLLPFPTWQATGPGKIQDVDLSATADAKSKADAAAQRAAVTPIYVVRLDDTHAALVTATVPVEEDSGRTVNCHACSASIGAYFFEHDADGWRLTARQDAAANSGVEGNIGETSIAKLGDGHYAVSAEWGSCWQGNCGSWLVVLGLQANQATLLESGIPLSINNDGAYGACSALDAPRKAKPAPGKDDDEDEDSNAHECLDIRSKWKFLQNRLLIDFEGRLSKLDTNGQLLPLEKVKQQVVYEIVHGLLKPVSGSNPVPAL